MTERPEAIVIGASAGALEALSIILPALPANFCVPIVVVVHIPPDKKSVLAEILHAKCRISVVEVEDKEPLLPGTAYVAPPDYHVLIEADNTLALTNEDPVLFSRPSIDVLFESAADALGSAVIGIVLSGANHDGARGLEVIVKAGGIALVQDPLQAFAAAMPEGAIRRCPNAKIMSPQAITAYLQRIS